MEVHCAAYSLIRGTKKIAKARLQIHKKLLHFSFFYLGVAGNKQK